MYVCMSTGTPVSSTIYNSLVKTIIVSIIGITRVDYMCVLRNKAMYAIVKKAFCSGSY